MEQIVVDVVPGECSEGQVVEQEIGVGMTGCEAVEQEIAVDVTGCESLGVGAEESLVAHARDVPGECSEGQVVEQEIVVELAERSDAGRFRWADADGADDADEQAVQVQGRKPNKRAKRRARAANAAAPVPEELVRVAAAVQLGAYARQRFRRVHPETFEPGGGGLVGAAILAYLRGTGTLDEVRGACRHKSKLGRALRAVCDDLVTRELCAST